MSNLLASPDDNSELDNTAGKRSQMLLHNNCFSYFFLDITDNAWTMSIVSGAVGGVIMLLIISLIITSAVCFLQQRTKESIPQEMLLQMQPSLSSHRQILDLVPDIPIIPDDRRSFTEDYILPFLGHNLATNKNSRLAYI